MPELNNFTRMPMARPSYMLPYGYDAQQVIDPLNNPYFGTAQPRRGGNPNSIDSAGNGDGSGFYDFSGMDGVDAFMGGNGDSPMGINPGALSEFLQQRGLTLNHADHPGSNGYARYLLDNAGQLVGDVQQGNYNDNNFGIAAMLAAGVTGAGAAGLFGGGGAAAGAGAAGAEAGIGTLGTIAPGAGASSALPTLAELGIGAMATPTAASLGIGELATLGAGGLAAGGGAAGGAAGSTLGAPGSLLGGAGAGTEGVSTLGSLIGTAAPEAATMGTFAPDLLTLGGAGTAIGAAGAGTAAGGFNWQNLLTNAMQNPRLIGAVAGGLLGGAGGGSGGGGGESYTGPMPTITRGNWSPSAQATMMDVPKFGGLLPQTGQANSGLWRFK